MTAGSACLRFTSKCSSHTRFSPSVPIFRLFFTSVKPFTLNLRLTWPSRSLGATSHKLMLPPAHGCALQGTTPLLAAASSVLLPPNPHPSPCDSFSAPEIQQAIPAALNDVSSNLKMAGNITPARDKHLHLRRRPARGAALGEQLSHEGVRALPQATGRPSFHAVPAYQWRSMAHATEAVDRRRSPSLENSHDGRGT